MTLYGIFNKSLNAWFQGFYGIHHYPYWTHDKSKAVSWDNLNDAEIALNFCHTKPEINTICPLDDIESEIIVAEITTT